MCRCSSPKEFPNVYKAAFDRAVARENMHGVFVEYAWDMGWCDPCAAQPMSNQELAELGRAMGSGSGGNIRRQPMAVGQCPTDAFVTRLHVRYDAKSFPEDLNFIETGDRENFQARYVLHHPYAGASCPAAESYRASLPARFKKEAENLADLTGWPQNDIAARMAAKWPAAFRRKVKESAVHSAWKNLNAVREKPSFGRSDAPRRGAPRW